MYKLFLLAAAAAAAPAADQAPSPYGPPQKQYNPVVYNEKEEILPPQPYEYKYGVNDDYSQTSFDKVESQDELGRVTGSYKVSKTVGIERYIWSYWYRLSCLYSYQTDTDYLQILPSISAHFSDTDADIHHTDTDMNLKIHIKLIPI